MALTDSSVIALVFPEKFKETCPRPHWQSTRSNATIMPFSVIDEQNDISREVDSLAGEATNVVTRSHNPASVNSSPQSTRLISRHAEPNCDVSVLLSHAASA